MDRFMHLVKWRKSTMEARRIGHAMLSTLNEIEESVLVHERPIPTQTEAIGRNAEWKVDELLAWATSKRQRSPDLSHVHSTESSLWYILSFSLLYIASGATLAFFHVNSKYESSGTYRTAAFSLLLAPLGAWCRWLLEETNSRRWIPLGTFFSNLLGSLLSIASIALEYKLYKVHQNFHFWKFASLRAVRIGFCGGLTTVSNLAEEVASLIKRKREDLAYLYTFLTIGLSCVLGCVTYGLILHYFTPV
jgi:fluoride ion exporter CrcB/FEX